MIKRCLRLAVWLVAGLASPALSQPVGSEFAVNTYTTDDQKHVAIAGGAAGDFIVVWWGAGPDTPVGVFGQRFDRQGDRVGDQFEVDTVPGGKYPSVAAAASGSFVVVWQGSGEDDGLGIFGQRYDSEGTPLGGQFRVNTHTAAIQQTPAVASDGDGNFVVVWTSDEQDGNDYGIFGQRFDANGNALGSEFQGNSFTTGRQTAAAVTVSGGGDFVVVWQGSGEGDGLGIFGQRYDGDGNTLGGEFRVNAGTENDQEGPSIASNASGRFIVVWTDHDSDVMAQRYDGDGTPIGVNFRVNTYSLYHQRFPAVTMDARGNFVVVWEEYHDDGGSYRFPDSSTIGHRPMPIGDEGRALRAGAAGAVPADPLLDPTGIFGQRFDDAGRRVGRSFQVNSNEWKDQQTPAIAADARGDFIVVWDRDADLLGYDGFGQRFSAGCEAALEVRGGFHSPGSKITIKVHIAHRRPKTVTVPWELSLIDASGQLIAKHVTRPHTFEPGDVVDRNVEFRLPDDVASGTYTLRLAISGMDRTKGATTTLRVVRAE